MVKQLKLIPIPKVNPENKFENDFKNKNDKNSSNIKEKIISFGNTKKLTKESNNDKNQDDEFEERKLKMISANAIQKYTFEKNTIQEYKRIGGKLVPINNFNK